MTAPVRGGAGGPRGTYFFLSYAHVPPLPDEDAPVRTEERPDYWVQRFYQDLRVAVAAVAAPEPPFDIGFLDSELPAGSDWKPLLTEALGEAQVFVPLYSPRYFEWSWPRSEQQSFFDRLSQVPPERAVGHIQPVLWIPIFNRSQLEESGAALAIGDGVPAYAEYGLRSLLRLDHLRPAYEEIVGRLARRIVEVAHTSPLERTTAPPLRPDFTAPGQANFVIGVLGPTADQLPSSRVPTAYDIAGPQWRPFGGPPALPVAEYAANLAERMDLSAQIASGPGTRELLESYPGLLLIDPRILTEGDRLRQETRDLREWVAPVVVLDPADPRYRERDGQAGQITDMLGELVSQPVRTVRGAGEFERDVPYLVANSRKQFLSNAKTSTEPTASAGNPPPPERTSND